MILYPRHLKTFRKQLFLSLKKACLQQDALFSHLIRGKQSNIINNTCISIENKPQLRKTLLMYKHHCIYSLKIYLTLKSGSALDCSINKI